MATAGKILGQVKSTAAPSPPTVLYTVPASTEAHVNIVFCNQHASNSDKVRIALKKSGDTLAEKHYIAYDLSLSAGAWTQITGLVLGTGDVIQVYSLYGYVAFTATGLEIT